MHSSDSSNASSPNWLRLLLTGGVPLVVLLMVVLEFNPQSATKKTKFSRVRITGCSTWTTEQARQDCVVMDPNKTTVASVLATQDYETLYFDLVVARRYSRPYWKGNYQRIEYEGQVKRDSSLEMQVEPRHDSYMQGSDVNWRKSFPRRLLWAKNVKRGQNITLELNSLRIFFDMKSAHAAHDYSRTGVVKFYLIAEADDNSLLRHIFWIKTSAFLAVLSLTLVMIYRSEKGHLPVLNSFLVGIAGAIFLVFTRPRIEELGKITPEEYFADENRLLLNYAAFLCFEIVMGIQAVSETLKPGSRLGKMIWPLICLGFPFLGYARHAHNGDFKALAQAYFNGQLRPLRFAYYKAYTVKALYLSSVPCLIINVARPWIGLRFSPVSMFIAYTMISFTADRHAMALFSTWKFARDLIVWVLGYMYLVFWVPEQPPATESPRDRTITEEEQVPISAAK